jgi:hypothetical protein
VPSPASACNKAALPPLTSAGRVPCRPTAPHSVLSPTAWHHSPSSPIPLSLGFSSSRLSALSPLPPSRAPDGSRPHHLPTPLSNQTRACRPPSASGEHLPHPDAVSHADSNFSPLRRIVQPRGFFVNLLAPVTLLPLSLSLLQETSVCCDPHEPFLLCMRPS